MDELKKIIATFVKKEPAEIDNNTVINRSVISGSILIHRMYAAINNAGYPIKDYSNINTYGALLNRLNGGGTDETAYSVQQLTIPSISRSNANAIGIDIESISNFDTVPDYREDPFYQLNFSAHEISYCILKENPLASFAGLFAAKEALCKASEALIKITFNHLEIKHDENGKPLFPGYAVSISHNDQFAVAIALSNESAPKRTTTGDSILENSLVTQYNQKISSLVKYKNILLCLSIISIVLLVILYLCIWNIYGYLN